MKITRMMLLLLMLLPIGVLSQTEFKAVISGKVTDSETGAPLDKVIVYLTNTSFGNSSGKDGAFKISFVPRGEYQLVVSRVGYERKYISFRINNSDSLYYEVKLQPRPISTNEVEVLGERPKEMKLRYGGKLFPKNNPNMYCVFSPVSPVPIGVFYSDSAYYMYSLETTVIDSQKFIRLWLLYKNQSKNPYHFNAMNCVKLHMEGSQHTYSDIRPLSTWTVFSITDSLGTIKTMLSSIGKSITNLAIQRSKYMLLGGYYVSSDLFEPRPIEDWSMSGTMYGTFRRSIDYGVLDKYLVEPDCTVDGYIYFSFPGGDAESTTSGFSEALYYTYRIEIMTQTGSKFIEFVSR